MTRDHESDEQYNRRMEREFMVRFWLTFGVPAFLVLLVAFVATSRS